MAVIVISDSKLYHYYTNDSLYNNSIYAMAYGVNN